MASITKSELNQIIELSAQNKPPKEIYETLGLDKAIVYAIRSQYRDEIEKRRTELAAKKPDMSPESAFAQIMGVIVPQAENFEPEPIAPSENMTAVGKAVSEGFDKGMHAMIADKSLLRAPYPAKNPDPPVGLTTTRVHLAGAKHRYTVTGKRIGIDGDLMLDADELTGFIRELESIQALIAAQEGKVTT